MIRCERRRPARSSSAGAGGAGAGDDGAGAGARFLEKVEVTQLASEAVGAEAKLVVSRVNSGVDLGGVGTLSLEGGGGVCVIANSSSLLVAELQRR